MKQKTKVRVTAAPRAFFMMSLVVFVLLWSVPLLAIAQGVSATPGYPRADDADTRTMIKLTVSTGEAAHDGILLENNTQQNKIFRLYAVDAETLPDGSHICHEPGSEKTSVGGWLFSDHNLVKLAVGERKLMDFFVRVPTTVAPGFYDGCVFIEEAIASQRQDGLRTFRKGIRVHVQVPDHVVQKIAPEGFSVVEKQYPEKGESHLLFVSRLRNNGSMPANVKVEVDMTNWYGGNSKSVETRMSIPEARTADWRFEMKPSFWGGVYRAEQIVEYARLAHLKPSNEGQGNKTAQDHQTSPLMWGANITGVSSASAASKDVVHIRSGTIWYFTPPTPLALLIEVGCVLAIFALFVLFRAYKRRRFVFAHIG